VRYEPSWPVIPVTKATFLSVSDILLGLYDFVMFVFEFDPEIFFMKERRK
jgi:hypothetical protein